MREHLPAQIIRTVEDEAVVTRLELRLAGDSLTGRARASSGGVREYTGRLAAIDALMAEALSAAPPSTPPR